MNKLDLSKKYKSYYTAKTQPELVDIAPAQFLSILGKGNPSGKLFTEKIQALYSIAYNVKFRYKAENQDFVVAKLEGLWWFDETKYTNTSISEAPKEIPREEWEYRLLIRMPDFVSQAVLEQAVQSVLNKKSLKMVEEVELYPMTEGKCVQILHLGAFDKEPETLQVMADFMQKHHLQKNGTHHEIYLSDFNKTSPEKLKTILREPVKS